MLKKAHKSSHNLGCPKGSCLQCTICKSTNSTKLYVCGSGHVICKNCQIANTCTVENRRDSGDFIQKSPKTNVEDNTLKLKRLNLQSDRDLAKELACGDYSKHSISDSKMRNTSNSKDNIICGNGRRMDNDKNFLPVESYRKINVETIIEFKNDNYNESDSSSSSLNIFSNCETGDGSRGINAQLSQKICQRPVTCPISHCKKMIAIDSVMLHYHFDHSKILRIVMNRNVLENVSLNISNITSSTECLAILLLHREEKLQTTNTTAGSLKPLADSKDCHNDNVLFLMGARLLIDRQDQRENLTKGQDNKIPPEDLVAKSNSFHRNEFLLLWICKADEIVTTYNITLLRGDKKQGHSYIGSSIKIKDNQDPSTMYHRSECLMVHGAAVNLLLESQKFIARINIL